MPARGIDRSNSSASFTRVSHPVWDRWTPRLLGVLIALLVLFPLLGRGYVLHYDMMFVPDPAIGWRGLGLDGSVPRAVPADFLVAVTSAVVPSWLLQQAILFAVLAFGALGMWRLSPARTLPGAAACAVLYAWNPYVAERLGMGHWSLLVGWALLPWIVGSTIRLRTEATIDGVLKVVVLLGIGAVAAPTAGVLTAVTAAVMVVGPLAAPAWRTRLVVIVTAVVFNAAWWLPGVLRSTSVDVADTGASAFSARADNPVGDVGSILSFGGIWNALVIPVSRESLASAIGTLLLVALGCLGLALLRRVLDRASLVSLLGLAAVGLMVPLLSMTAAGNDVIDSVSRHVPGGGLLRDAQKWVVWWLLPVAMAVGTGVEWVAARLRGGLATGWLVAMVAWPLVMLPSMAWGLGGQLEAHSWPDDYEAAASTLSAAEPGAAVVLPWHAFRAWPWNGNQTALDPWNRLVSGDVVARDDLELSRRTVPGEDPRVPEVTELLTSGADVPAGLLAMGIRYVVIDRSTAGDDDDVERHFASSDLIYDGRDVAVADLGSTESQPLPHPNRAVVLSVDLLAGLGWLGALAWLMVRRVFR